MNATLVSILRRSVVAASCAALVLAAPACGELDTDSMTDDLATYEAPGENLDGKDDSATRPTPQGALQLNLAATKTLSSRSGFHSYTFAGRPGAKVKLTLKSRDYRVYLRITSPAGTRWSVPGVRKSGAWYSSIELSLRLSGNYKILATSYQNLYTGRMLSRGSYTLSAEGEQLCGGIAAIQCPQGQKCLLDGSYPDAGGRCVAQTACRAPSDCDGLSPPYRCWGGWTCNGATSTELGTCNYQCGLVTDECAGLDVRACNENPRCEIAAVGCERPACDPETGVCRPCDPIAECRKKQVANEGEACGSRGLLPCAEGLYCAFGAQARCGELDVGGTCARRPDACIQIYQPVCGCDGRTYGNACTAASAGMSVRSSGECR